MHPWRAPGSFDGPLVLSAVKSGPAASSKACENDVLASLTGSRAADAFTIRHAFTLYETTKTAACSSDCSALSALQTLHRYSPGEWTRSTGYVPRTRGDLRHKGSSIGCPIQGIKRPKNTRVAGGASGGCPHSPPSFPLLLANQQGEGQKWEKIWKSDLRR